MALIPKPISLTQVDEDDYTAPYLPQPMVVVGDLPVSSAVTALTAITTADATDEATAVTLANATKAKVNAIIAALKA